MIERRRWGVGVSRAIETIPSQRGKSAGERGSGRRGGV